MTVRFEQPVGDVDFLADTVCIPAPPRPGLAAEIVAVEDGFQAQGVVAPHGLSGWSRWPRAKLTDQIGRRVLGEGPDPLGAGVVERAVDQSDRGLQVFTLRCGVGDRLTTFVLVLLQRSETVSKSPLGCGSLPHSLLGEGHAGPGLGHRFSGLTSPPASPGRFEPGAAVSELPFCFVCRRDRGG